MLQFDLSCKNTRQTLGAMFMRTNYVTLKYVTDAWGTDNNGFKLVITAVKDPSEYTLACSRMMAFMVSGENFCCVNANEAEWTGDFSGL